MPTSPDPLGRAHLGEPLASIGISAAGFGIPPVCQYWQEVGADQGTPRTLGGDDNDHLGAAGRAVPQVERKVVALQVT